MTRNQAGHILGWGDEPLFRPFVVEPLITSRLTEAIREIATREIVPQFRRSNMLWDAFTRGDFGLINVRRTMLK